MNPCPKCGAPVAPEENLRFCPNCLYNAIGDPQSTGTGGLLTSEGWTLGQFGQYELIEVVGKGGMGIVFRARDCTLGRIVALKILRGGALASERDINRFQEEAMLAAALQHPNIVPIFEAGVIDGQPFIAMPYLEGKNLGSMAGQGMSPRRAAEIALRVSEALAHAHSRGIIHRDLKPSNVHVDTHNQVRVLDFGLARRLDGSNELTLTGQILGTPSFMAPEQAMGKSLEIEVRTDVYGIGATLFFLLTGHPPFEADNVASTLHAVMFDDPKPVQAWNPSLDGDLATVVMKCLHKERHQRYPTAEALAEDLRRYIGGEPVSARPLDNWQVLKRWSKRNKPIAVTIATVFIALILGVAATVNAFNSNRMQSQAELFNYVAGVSGAYGAWRSGNTGHALDLLRAQIAVDESRDIRSLDWGILRALCEGQEDRLIDLGIGPLRDISVDPSGTRFAVTGTSNLFIGTLAMAGPAKTLPLPFERYNRRIHWHPNGESLFLSQTNGILQVWIDDSRSTLWETGPCTHFAVSPDGTRIAHCSVPLQAGNDPVPLLVWDFTRSAHIATNAGLGGPVTKWSPDSSSLLGVDREGQLIHWNPDLASSRIVIPGNGENKTAALSSSTHWLARAHWGGQIGIHSTTNQFPAGDPDSGFGGYLPGRPRNTGLAFTDDNQWLVHLATDHRIHFAQFDPTTQRWHDLFHRSGHTREVTALSPIPGRQAIVSCSEDGTVRVWDCRPTKPPPNLSSQLTNVVGIRAPLISHDGVWAALLVDFPNSNVLWNLRTGEVQPPFLGEAVAFSKEHELLIRTPEDFLEFRPLNGRATNHHVRLPIQSSVEPWQASPDTHWIGLLDSTNQLVFVDWKQPAVTRTFGQANTFEFLPDSRRVIVSLPTEEILLIEIDSLSSKRISTVNSEKIAVSPDGTLVALGTWEHHIDIVEIETGKLQGSLLGHQAGILSLSFSPDNRTLVSTGEDKTIRFWNLKTMRQTSEYPQSQTVRWLTCSPDSSGLLVGTYLRYEFWKCSFSAQ